MQESENQIQQGIIEAVAEEWQEVWEESEGGDQPFAEQLKCWFDNQLDELHDSAGDTEYQGQVIQCLKAFRSMVQQIKAYDFGLDGLDEAIERESK